MHQTSIDYKIILPDGSWFVVGPNKDAAGFVALLDKIDTAVELAATDTPDGQADGALLGDGYLGVRTVNLELLIDTHDPQLRADRIESIQRINSVLRGDDYLTLQWTEATGFVKQIEGLRARQPAVPMGEFPKQMQLLLSTGQPNIVSEEVHYREIEGASGATTVINAGNTTAAPVVTVHGPCDASGFVIVDAETSAEIRYEAAIADGHYVQIDTAARTVLLDGTTNVYGNLDVFGTEFFGIPAKAANRAITFGASGSGANTKLELRWQSAWR